jgi:hypothetical protein
MKVFLALPARICPLQALRGAANMLILASFDLLMTVVSS